MNKLVGKIYIENRERNKIIEKLIDYRANMEQSLQHGTHEELMKDSKRFYETVVEAYEIFNIETYYLTAAYNFLNNEDIL